MTFSTSFSNKALLVFGFLLLVMPGSALTAQSPPLQLHSLDSEVIGSLQTHQTAIRWRADVSGGKGVITYRFFTVKDSVLFMEQEGDSPIWEWIPQKPGRYRIKVVVVDSRGDVQESPWSEEFTVDAPSARDALIALLPVENLSGSKAPLQDITASLRVGLTRKGFRLLDQDTLERFRKKYRMRYTGGVSSKISQAMQVETGVDGFFITSLEAYHEQNPPQISLISRLVSSGSQPEIIWIDSVGLSGDESPGLLDLKRITDSKLLLEKAVAQLTAALTVYLDFDKLSSASDTTAAADAISSTDRIKRKYMPYDYFRSQAVDPNRSYAVAVIPMLNLAVRKNAGRIVSLHHIRELVHLTDYKVIEPGVVREELLRFRAIMPAGPSLAVADLITSPGSLGVELVLSGKVFDYQDSAINPKVDYSVQVIEGRSRKVVFGARTFSTGDKGVYFFDFGRVYTAHNLLAELSRTTIQLFSTPAL